MRYTCPLPELQGDGSDDKAFTWEPRYGEWCGPCVYGKQNPQILSDKHTPIDPATRPDLVDDDDMNYDGFVERGIRRAADDPTRRVVREVVGRTGLFREDFDGEVTYVADTEVDCIMHGAVINALGGVATPDAEQLPLIPDL